MTTFRPATLEDAEAIAHLHADSWRRTYRGHFLDSFLDGDVLANRREVWAERLTRSTEAQLVRVAVEQSQLAGFVCAYGGQDPEWGSLIDNLHVDHGHRRKGIAAALMQDVAALLVESYGQCGVYLWVWEANSAARSFYERLGAANAGISEIENPGGGTGRSCRYVWANPSVLAGYRKLHLR